MTYYKIQLRYDTLENWEDANPVLSVAEAAYVIDTGGIKVGDGFTPFNNLDYIPALDQTTISRLNDLEVEMELKVDKVEGKGLSTEDFTTALKNKLEHINWSDIENKPTIPTKTSDLTNDSGYISTESDPVFSASPSANITSQDITNWNNKSDFSGNYNDLTHKPNLSMVATTGDYDDLNNKPTIPTKTSDLVNDSGFITTETDPIFTVSPAHGITSQDIEDWNNKSDFSGSYNDLTDKPTIPDPQVQADWTERDSTKASYIKNKPSMPSAQIQSDWNQTNTSEVDYIKNKPTNVSDFNNDAGYSTFSGDYDDLTNKPSIPSKTSDLTNDSGFIATETDPVFTASPAHDITAADITAWNGKSDFSGSYNDLTDKPTIPAAQIQSDWSQSDNTSLDYIKNKPNLSTVATSGDYDDLTNKPTIPDAPVQSDWNENDNTSLAYIQNKPTIPSAQVNSDWNSNSGVSQILNKPTIIDSTGSVNILHLAYVSALPASPDPNTVYFILES